MGYYPGNNRPPQQHTVWQKIKLIAIKCNTGNPLVRGCRFRPESDRPWRIRRRSSSRIRWGIRKWDEEWGTSVNRKWNCVPTRLPFFTRPENPHYFNLPLCWPPKTGIAISKSYPNEIETTYNMLMYNEREFGDVSRILITSICPVISKEFSISKFSFKTIN